MAARGLSYLVNPFILTPILLALVLRYFGAPASEIYRVTGIALVWYTVLPLLYLFYLVRKRYAHSVDVPVRQNRVRPLLGGLLSSLIGLAMIAAILNTARTLVLALLSLYIFHALLLLGITRKKKISLHLFSLSGFNAVLLGLQIYTWPYPSTAFNLHTWWLLSLLLIPFLMWARVHLRVHTPSEVLLGFILGQLLPLTELYLLHLLL